MNVSNFINKNFTNVSAVSLFGSIFVGAALGWKGACLLTASDPTFLLKFITGAACGYGCFKIADLVLNLYIKFNQMDILAYQMMKEDGGKSGSINDYRQIIHTIQTVSALGRR